MGAAMTPMPPTTFRSAWHATRTHAVKRRAERSGPRHQSAVDWLLLMAVVVVMTPVVWWWGELPAGDPKHLDD